MFLVALIQYWGFEYLLVCNECHQLLRQLKDIFCELPGIFIDYSIVLDLQKPTAAPHESFLVRRKCFSHIKINSLAVK